MRQALAKAYPPGSSLLERVFGPVIDPWTYARALHLVAMFPLGLAYFVGLVVALSLGVALSWTLLGPPLLLVAMYLTRWAGDGEAWVVRHLHGMELRRPPTTIERGSYRSQVWARIIDPTTWTGALYLFVQFPVGLAMFVLLTVLTAVGVALAVSAFAVQPTDLDVVIREASGTEWWLPYASAANALAEARWPLRVLGAALLLSEFHLVNLLSAVHAWWAQLMLGSRAPHIVPGAPLGLPPADPSNGGDTPPDPGTTAPADAPSEGDPEGAERARRLVEADYRLAQVRSVSSGSRAVASATHQPTPHIEAVSSPLLESLTPREREVLRLMARGYSNAEIAEAFVVSEGTVKTHVKRVLAKLELRDRTQAAVWSFDHGFVLPAVPPGAGESAAPPEPLRLRAPR